jgi:hypothetical protein
MFREPFHTKQPKERVFPFCSWVCYSPCIGPYQAQQEGQQDDHDERLS